MPSVPLCFAISLSPPKMRHLLNLLIAVCFPQIHCSVPVGIVNSGDPSYSSSSFYWNNRSQRATWFRSVQLFDHIWFIVIPWTAACQAFLSITNSQTLLKLMSIKLAMPSNHLILCHSLLLLPSICPSIRVFSPASGIKELLIPTELEHDWWSLLFHWEFEETNSSTFPVVQTKTDTIWYHLYVES